MKLDAITNHLELANEIRALIAETNRLQNELKEAEGYLYGMLLTNGGKVAYRHESQFLQLYDGQKNGIARLREKGLELIESHTHLQLNYKGLSIYEHGGPKGWEQMKEALPELFYK